MTITIYTDRCNSRPEYRLFEDFLLFPSTFLNVTLNIFNCPSTLVNNLNSPQHFLLSSSIHSTVFLSIFKCSHQDLKPSSSTSSNVLSVLNRILANSKWKVKTSFQSPHSLQYSIISSPERWPLLDVTLCLWANTSWPFKGFYCLRLQGQTVQDFRSSGSPRPRTWRPTANYPSLQLKHYEQPESHVPHVRMFDTQIVKILQRCS